MSVSVKRSFGFSWSLLLFMLMPRHFGCVFTTKLHNFLRTLATRETQRSHHDHGDGTTPAGHTTDLGVEPTAIRLYMRGCCDAAASNWIFCLLCFAVSLGYWSSRHSLHYFCSYLAVRIATRDQNKRQTTILAVIHTTGRRVILKGADDRVQVYVGELEHHTLG